ncbi:Wall-associated receptor kinase-like 9 [Citrus sinensis]|uniref:Wall-associated receptor kinase-like 9 n=1 Tax=Citrus sinensis TaxID=2711 RepID=A0ACB8M4H4_CITSI|nr:Wall-associated receptor kinase-like 9 [Citrus sinensis]
MAAHLSLVLLQIIVLHLRPIKASERFPCPTECGNISISYPFGIGKGCYFDKGYEVICDHSSGSHKAFLPGVNRLELLDIFSYSKFAVSVNVPTISLNSSSKRTSNIAKGVNLSVTPSESETVATLIRVLKPIRVYIPVISLKSSNLTSNDKGVSLSGSPFTFSRSRNRFTAIGCNNYSTIIKRHNDSSVFGGCLSISTCDPALNPGCYDFLCTLPQNITQVSNAQISNFYSKRIPQKCHSVSMVEEDWINSKYLKNPHVLKDHGQVPALLEWATRRGDCYEEYNSKTTCRLLCNITSPYNCSSGFPKGYFLDNYLGGCTSSYEPNPILHKNSHVKFIIIGCNSGLGMLFLLIGTWWLYKFIKRRREIKLKQKFFKRNGGLLLQQQSSSNEGNTQKTKLFTSMELEMATDNFNTNRILGQGGQGTVYKGMLTDGRIAAVKKSKLVDESNIEQFINEVVILTQINHRNVVKLFGCCLETEVPLLVYEFIPNGTLYQYIHDQTEEFSITWEMRLRIAIEVSSALSYLHSTTSIPIYHRDIKSANILLDDKFRAKVSDFGASRCVTIDQTHLTTRVLGTFGYLDPEYFRSSQFTEKSDVYCFGVVLVELLTGQKPIRSTEAEEDKSLAGYFLLAMKENRLFDVLDTQVLREAKEEEIITVGMLAKRCLNLNGTKRPTMKEVAFELGGIRAQKCEDIDLVGGNFETGSSSTGAILNAVAFSVDASPLLSNKW